MAIHEDNLPRLQSQLQSAQASGNDVEAAELFARITRENEKRSQWAVSDLDFTSPFPRLNNLVQQFENSLRRHNHVGLLHALTLALAKSGRLSAITEQAKAKLKERIERRRKEGKMEED